MYATARKGDAPEKHAVANRIITEGEYLISAQVLGEFYHRVRHIQHELMPALKAQEWMKSFEAYCAIGVDLGIIHAAMYIRERFKIRFWDAAIVAAAQRLELSTLYSEDMSHGQKYGSVTVINPFKAH